MERPGMPQPKKAVGTKQSQPKREAISTSGGGAIDMRVPKPPRILARPPCAMDMEP